MTKEKIKLPSSPSVHACATCGAKAKRACTGESFCESRSRAMDALWKELMHS